MDKSSSVLQQHPSTLLGLKLTSTQQVLCCFVVPTIANCAIYILDIASNVAVVYRHFQESNDRWAISTMLIMYVPSVVFFALTVSKIETWNEQFKQSRVIKWFFARILHLVAFPILGMYRFAKVLFWSIDALIRQGNEREESLKYVTRPSSIELYLFLQAYLQGLPQSILQLSILVSEHNDNRETDSMQVLCIASSLMIVATITVSFQRFESQRTLGRVKPWAEVPPDSERTVSESDFQEVENNIEHQENEYINEKSDDEQPNPYLDPRSALTDQNVEDLNNYFAKYPFGDRFSEVSEITPEQSNNISEAEVAEIIPVQSTNTSEAEVTEIIPVQSTNTSEAEVTEIIPVQSTNMYEDEEIYVDPITLKKDSDTNSPIYSTPILPPPLPSQPPEPLPVRRQLEFPTRKISVRGLKQDELLGKCVSFLTWFFFLASRVISLVVFFHFFIWAGLGISIFHYLITLLVLHKNAKTIPTVLLKLALAFVFCFCLIEFKVKFTKVYLIYTAFFFTTIMENILCSTAWYLFHDWEGWWYHYTYSLICLSQAFSVMCVMIYYFILKPKSQEFYPDDST